MAFYKAEGVAVVLQCESGWLGAVRGFARPGTRDDKWSREATLAAPPIVEVTPEHYNRMYRILKRDIPVKVEIEVRNRVGEKVEQAVNVIGEIPGSDLKDEVVMIGAHFDTWHASPNASDNTSGVAVALEAARILQGGGREAAADDSRRAVGRRGAGAVRLARVRAEALRRPEEGRQPGVRQVLGLLQPGLRRGPVPRDLPAGERARAGDADRVDAAVPRLRDDGRVEPERRQHRSRLVRRRRGCPASSSSRTGSRAPAATPTWTSSTPSRRRT